MKIVEYSFGRMVYGPDTYTSDLIIYPNGVDNKWWRGQGHLLQMEDLTEILAYEPEVLIIGTGYMGIMRVPKELKKELGARVKELHVARTKKAVTIFNDCEDKSKVIAAFHLTC